MEDKYLWLEDIEGKKALKWVKEQNSKTLDHFQKDSYLNDAYDTVLGFLEDPKKIPIPIIINDELHNFWTDKKHSRGLWRKCSIESFIDNSPNWETVLDLDKLAADEKRNWVKRGLQRGVRISPDKSKAMIALSDGGKDANIWREFCFKTNQFIENGFVTHEAKSYVEWLNEDTLLVSTNFGQESITLSGYPRTTVKWKRDTPLNEAKTISKIPKDHMSSWVDSIGEGNKRTILISDAIDFFNSKTSIFKDDKSYPFPTPTSTSLLDVVDDQFCFYAKEDVEINNTNILAGSMFSISESDVYQGKIEKINIIFTPTNIEFSDDYGQTVIEHGLVFTAMREVQGVTYKTIWDGAKWNSQELDFPKSGNVMVLTGSKEHIFINYEDFLTPQSLHYYNCERNEYKMIDSLTPYFDSSKYQVEQIYTESSDKERIPYFLITAKGSKRDGSTPTILNGYGGFNISYSPHYLRDIGPLWLDNGGAFVVANIRGGGEFGPKWHQAALKGNRQKSFDDFIAVAEDLISTGVSSPEHLGIWGGSNGGLLTSAVFTQRPDLLKASCTTVPLIDMLRFHKLLAGHSWTAEYGNPDIPEEREHILKYSPYQNVSKEKKYPKVFLMTSTKDDRVHPGHARKMAKKMMDMGHELYYYENTEGGHAGSSNNIQRAKWISLELSYFKERLFSL